MTPFQKTVKYIVLAIAICLIVGILAGMVSAIAAIFTVTDRTEVAGDGKTYHIGQEAQHLKIDISAAKLTVTEGDRFLLESNHKNLKVTERNGTLKITETKKLFGGDYQGVYLTLTVPYGYIFDSVDIESGAADVEIAALSAVELSLEFGAGKVTVGSLTAVRSADIDTGAGDVTVSGGSLRDLNLDMGAGNVRLISRLLGDADIDQGVGTMYIQLLGDRNTYTVDLDKGLGKAQLDGETVKRSQVIGSGEIDVKIDCGIGDIQVEFE